jgi:hypothetical protein
MVGPKCVDLSTDVLHAVCPRLPWHSAAWGSLVRIRAPGIRTDAPLSASADLVSVPTRVHCDTWEPMSCPFVRNEPVAGWFLRHLVRGCT